MQHHLNIDDVLLSAVYLKELQARSSYPTLDQKSNTPFSIYIYTSTKFGFKDAGGLSCLTKSKLATLFNQNYPPCIHKLCEQELIKLSKILTNSYVDDLHIGCTIEEVKSEALHPMFIHKLIKNFDKHCLTQLVDHIVISKALKILQVIDFSGFLIKNFSSSSYWVQSMLNTDSHLQCKKS